MRAHASDIADSDVQHANNKVGYAQGHVHNLVVRIAYVLAYVPCLHA